MASVHGELVVLHYVLLLAIDASRCFDLEAVNMIDLPDLNG